jgi:2-polyprenyl-6-methoxyphenol hydroxylase-like FAD-dependent oxidoreductase
VNTVPPRHGRVAVVGAGPAGMATALSVHQAGHDVTLLERYPQARPRATSSTCRTVQGSWTAIRSKGRDGFQWWVLSAYDAAQPFTGDLHAAATAMGAEFPAPLPQLIAATHAANVQRWVLRDRKPLKQWSKGRATIVGDAAHPTESDDHSRLTRVPRTTCGDRGCTGSGEAG